MSSREPQEAAAPEGGDYIINWHLQYVSSLLLQGDTTLRQITDLIKAEEAKIRTDSDYIKNNFDGSHKNLMRLKVTDREMKDLLSKIAELSDKLRKVSAAASNRII